MSHWRKISVEEYRKKIAEGARDEVDVDWIEGCGYVACDAISAAQHEEYMKTVPKFPEYPWDMQAYAKYLRRMLREHAPHVELLPSP